MNPTLAFRFLSWEDIEACCALIHRRIVRDGYQPQCIVGLSRGGIVPARIFSDYFHLLVDFFALDVKFYRKIGQTMDRPIVGQLSGDVHGKRILIVDDIWDSGRTMAAVLDGLQGETIRTATLLWKETAPGRPDYHAGKAGENEWIVFPWEKHEFRRCRRPDSPGN